MGGRGRLHKNMVIGETLNAWIQRNGVLATSLVPLSITLLSNLPPKKETIFHFFDNDNDTYLSVLLNPRDIIVEANAQVISIILPEYTELTQDFANFCI